MSRSLLAELPLGRPLDLAVALAVISGLGALVDPDLGGLVVAVSGLAVAAYLLEYRRAHDARLAWDRWALAALGSVAIGAGAFAIAGGPPWGALRGLALGVSLVPMGWTARRFASIRTPLEAT